MKHLMWRLFYNTAYEISGTTTVTKHICHLHFQKNMDTEHI